MEIHTALYKRLVPSPCASCATTTCSGISANQLRSRSCETEWVGGSDSTSTLTTTPLQQANWRRRRSGTSFGSRPIHWSQADRGKRSHKESLAVGDRNVLCPVFSPPPPIHHTEQKENAMKSLAALSSTFMYRSNVYCRRHCSIADDIAGAEGLFLYALDSLSFSARLTLLVLRGESQPELLVVFHS